MSEREEREGVARAVEIIAAKNPDLNPVERYQIERAAALLRGQQVEPKEGDAHWRRGYNQGWDERKAFDERRVDAPPARQQDEEIAREFWAHGRMRARQQDEADAAHEEEAAVRWSTVGRMIGRYANQLVESDDLADVMRTAVEATVDARIAAARSRE